MVHNLRAVFTTFLDMTFIFNCTYLGHVGTPWSYRGTHSDPNAGRRDALLLLVWLGGTRLHATLLQPPLLESNTHEGTDLVLGLILLCIYCMSFFYWVRQQQKQYLLMAVPENMNKLQY